MRSQVLLRPAVDGDAPELVALWDGALRRVGAEQQLEDVRRVIDQVSAMPEERVVVAELDGRVIGAVHLRSSTVSPLNPEPVVQVISPHVLPECRRHGVGRRLMEAAVAFADELGIAQLATAVTSGARESHRFMARLGLGPSATVRVAPTVAVKGRLGGARPRLTRGSRQMTAVLAARRSMRRSG